MAEVIKNEMNLQGQQVQMSKPPKSPNDIAPRSTTSRQGVKVPTHVKEATNTSLMMTGGKSESNISVKQSTLD